MKITYDKSVDAAYIYLNDSNPLKVINTDSFEIKELIPFGDINLDFDQNNLIMGIEILNASKYLLPEVLASAKSLN